ncbi:MAG: hypothetical protein KC546_08305 [Anaerolineae bacterium]|nr:hypothetical protein [Anaerolineae bacterium]MCA9888361.1 hypothetical protein [Anaerolineae bacterium]MCA9891590.1 hypothetical protein [Anaerolineae bacterium]MCB9461968.1 hypothetical protein [Anaerolineaceae bacterium]
MRSRTAYFAIIGLLLVGLGITLIGCTPDRSAPELASVETIESAVTATPAEVALASLSLTQVPPFTDVECLACHTNQAQLTLLAIPEDNEAESLSSGPG